MTGFAKATGNFQQRKIIFEIKTLNSNRGTDAMIKLPTAYRSLEYRIRQLITEKLQRGKTDVSLLVETDGSETTHLNTQLVKSIFGQLKAVADEMGASSDHLLPAILRMPEVTGENDSDISEEELAAFEKVLNDAIQATMAFRLKEGATLEADFNKRISAIEASMADVKTADAGRVEKIRARLTENLQSFIPVDKIDPNRFEQEVIYYLEKLDINEELSRLAMHCTHFRECMNTAEVLKGRKLGFIAQEIGREINTIGSKANDAAMQRMVVNMKDELEKIKEQVNNVL